jgi:hypothetical protein
MNARFLLCSLGFLVAAIPACQKAKIYKVVGLPVCQGGERSAFAGRYELLYKGTELGMQTLTGQGRDTFEVRAQSNELVVALVSCPPSALPPSGTPAGTLDEHNVPTVCQGQLTIWQGRLSADSDTFRFPSDFPKATLLRCQALPDR